MSQQERLQKRSLKIKQTYRSLTEKYPQWRNDAIVENLADTFFLAPRTIEAILRGEGKTYS
ncbi:hypothetical protein [Psychroflexus sp. MBR-150]|jgi:hypothetical protein